LPRYRFADFTLSPRRRVLLRGGRELPLIPRYFDLLVFLVERRHEAVHRRDIFDHVWSEVVVSDSALSQAVRTLRRALEDDPREPRFIRTVARHGYQFIFDSVVVDDEEGPLPAEERVAAEPSLPARANAALDAYEPLLTRLTAPGAGEEDQREAAELLHALGTAEALRRLGARPRHAHARAVLRDTRWDVAVAGPVPILGQPGSLAAGAALVALRLRRAARAAAARWLSAAVAAGVAGFAAGAIGGLMLILAPGSTAPVHVVGVLASIGGCLGAVAGAGVGAGITVGEATARSQRLIAVAAGGAVGGAVVGYAAQWLAGWTLETLVGVHVPVGGGLEGLVLGASSGLGYAVATRRTQGGLAAPRGRRRVEVAAGSGLACTLGGVLLALAGRPLVGGTIHMIAQVSAGSQAMLTPLGHLIGEPDFGPLTRLLIAAGEAGTFGAGLAIGVTRSPTSHDLLTNR
jgi:DNA-binding winged helix-turn-helix (wHTH) protein